MENLESLAAYQRKMRIEEKANSIGYAVGLTVGVSLYLAGLYSAIMHSSSGDAILWGAFLGPLISGMAGSFVGLNALGISSYVLNKKSNP